MNLRRSCALLFVAVLPIAGCPSDSPEEEAASSTSEASTSEPGSTSTPGTTTAVETSETGTTTTMDGTTDASADDTSTGGALGCPTHIRTERVASLVSLSYGWTGVGHGADPVDGMVVSYALVEG